MDNNLHTRHTVAFLWQKMVRCYYSAVCVLFCQGTMVTQFVEGWDFVQTLGEGAYGEYVLVSC